MVNYLDYFGVKSDYTKDELKKAYISKLEHISKLDISSTDKTFFIEQTHNLYRKAKSDYYEKNNITFPSYINSYSNMLGSLKRFDNFMNKFFEEDNFKYDNNFKSYSSYKSYNEKLNDDNSKTIVETVHTNKDGIEEKYTNSYKKYPDGRIEKIDNSKMLK